MLAPRYMFQSQLSKWILGLIVETKSQLVCRCALDDNVDIAVHVLHLETFWVWSVLCFELEHRVGRVVVVSGRSLDFVKVSCLMFSPAAPSARAT